LSAENLSAGKDAIQELKEFFDSPIREPQLHVLAAIFGKTMLAREDLASRGAMEISVSA
jgi:hypothetical protein